MIRRQQQDRWAGRHGYRLAALGVALFVVYGSLVPLVFRPIPFLLALRQFLAALRGPVTIDSNTDFVTNVLLAVPLGYFAIAALMTDRSGSIRRFAAALVALGCCFSVSIGAEFAQLFFQGRTASASDIVAQCGGAVIGVCFWMLAGERVTLWLRDLLAERARPALAERLLLAYCVLFAVTQVMPLDLTLSLGQLAQKYRSGMVLIRPFTYVHLSTFEMWWDYLGDVVINAPIGSAAVLIWTTGRSPRRPVIAWAFGTAVVALIELAQVFVRSRFSDSTDVITGSVGVAIGVALAVGLSTREAATSSEARWQKDGVARFARIAAAVWLLVLMAYHWNPFNFTTDPALVTSGMHQLLSVPLYSYYMGSEFHALTEMLRKSLLAAPLGLLLQLAWPAGSDAPLKSVRSTLLVALGFGVLVTIEVGQVFLPTRTPDITDPIIGGVAIAAAFFVTGHLLRLPAALQSATGESRP